MRPVYTPKPDKPRTFSAAFMAHAAVSIAVLGAFAFAMMSIANIAVELVR